MRDRQIEYDLKFLRAVCNWALEAKVDGKLLLARSPFGVKSCRLPKEKNPRRPVMTDAQYAALLDVADEFNWRFRLALVLAHETGHRQSAVRLLRWSDVDLESRSIRWRAEHEKTGYEHVTPLSEEARTALEGARGNSLGIGDAWVFPSPRSPGRPVSKNMLDRCMQRAQTRAGLEALGWHSLRRKFATELKDVPLIDLCALGGWKDPKTILMCYQIPDQESMRAALEARRPLKNRVSESTDNRQTCAKMEHLFPKARSLS